jgi:hypothetical protein
MLTKNSLNNSLDITVRTVYSYYMSNAINTADNRYFFNNGPIGSRDCEDGGLEGMYEGPTAKQVAEAKASALAAKAYNASANTLNARRCKEVEVRAAAMTTKLGRTIKNSEMDTIRWQVSKAIL